MIERRRGHVESIRQVNHIDNNLAECEVQIDFDIYTIFYDPAELLQFANKDVLYTTRFDIVRGNKTEVICEIALVTEVVTVDKERVDVKLIPFDVKRPVCNFNIKDVKFGEYKAGCIAILTKMTEGQSRKANWIDLELIDAYGHLFDLRMFTTTAGLESIEYYSKMINGYVEFDLESTKYGYQTSAISSLPQDVEKSPEIAIARNIVMSFIKSDDMLDRIVAETGLCNAIDGFVDYEPGYLWVRMASELYMIDTLDNITSGVNILAMKRAVICTRLFTLPHNIPWSNGLINLVKILKYNDITKDEDLRSILDIFYQGTISDTRDMYLKVRDIVDSIISSRRGLKNEKENYGGIIDECHIAFNGLL